MHCTADKLKMTNPNHPNRVHLGDMKLVIRKNFMEKFCHRQPKVACRKEIPKQGNIPGRSIRRRLALLRVPSIPTVRKLEVSN
ncbi:hypothetical protein HanIR_Chr05g0217091 [Helianthus annuus]|nr:hypothetical protein HanIR_Chr05g0217091 [Helianthus annuus]